MTLRDVRRKSGIKAMRIAKELGISRIQLYNLENGKNNFSDDKIVKLSEVYGMSKKEIEHLINIRGGKTNE